MKMGLVASKNKDKTTLEKPIWAFGKVKKFLIILFILFIILKSWKQPKCSLTREWINKLWYNHPLGYYTASGNI